MKKFLHAILVSVITVSAYAQQQTSCSQTLRLARSTYDQGRLHEIPTLLEKCLEGGGFTKQEQVDAYKLLCLSYIYLEEPEQADEAMLNLLKTDSYFTLNEAVDPAEFVSLYKTFRTNPIYRMGAKIGANSTVPHVAERIVVVDGTHEYAPAVSLQFGAAFELPINKKFTLAPELYYQDKTFSYSSTTPLTDSDGDNDDSSTTEAVEKEQWISLPISIQYNIMKSNINPYVALGISTDYLLGSEITIDRKRENASPVGEKTVDIKPLRSSLNLSAIASAGAKFKMGGGYILTELRFYYGISKVSNKNTAFENPTLALGYGYADSPFHLNSIAFNIGYIINVFKPKKLVTKK